MLPARRVGQADDIADAVSSRHDAILLHPASKALPLATLDSALALGARAEGVALIGEVAA